MGFWEGWGEEGGNPDYRVESWGIRDCCLFYADDTIESNIRKGK